MQTLSFKGEVWRGVKGPSCDLPCSSRTSGSVSKLPLRASAAHNGESELPVPRGNQGGAQLECCREDTCHNCEEDSVVSKIIF